MKAKARSPAHDDKGQRMPVDAHARLTVPFSWPRCFRTLAAERLRFNCSVHHVLVIAPEMVTSIHRLTFQPGRFLVTDEKSDFSTIQAKRPHTTSCKTNGLSHRRGHRVPRHFCPASRGL